MNDDNFYLFKVKIKDVFFMRVMGGIVHLV